MGFAGELLEGEERGSSDSEMWTSWSFAVGTAMSFVVVLSVAIVKK
jgi:hypothetical protein